jgi:hypothetical protein
MEYWNFVLIEILTPDYEKEIRQNKIYGFLLSFIEPKNTKKRSQRVEWTHILTEKCMNESFKKCIRNNGVPKRSPIPRITNKTTFFSFSLYQSIVDNYLYLLY